jgi:cytochrome oxidase Cu insertion factor (SCO1/SenC/PrrC family)
MATRSNDQVDGVLALVDAVRGEPGRRAVLVEFLRDEHEVYRNRGALDVVRLRGFVMQAFGDVGLPEDALPFVLEDLESSYDAYAVAAAARALRGWTAPSRDVMPLLLGALENVRGRDEYVSFAAYAAVGEPGTGTTATAEVEATLRWLESAARPACCCGSKHARGISRFDETDSTQPSQMLELEFEDHDARTITFGDMFTGRPSIVVFFYTRCENPRKCSLTIEKLGRLQVSLASAGLSKSVRIAAITYDPEFDSPSRLKGYATARRFRPGDEHRLLRATRGMQALQEYFSLGVNYVHSIVNRHRVELYVLDANARVAASFLRLEWDEQEVLDEVRRLVDRSSSRVLPSGRL